MGQGAPDQTLWLDRVWRDIDNFRAALEWARQRSDAALLASLAVALATFFEDFGDHREGGTWLRAAEEHANGLGPGPRAGLLFHLANYEIWHGGDRAAVRGRYAECLAIRELLGDEVGAAFALTQLSAVAADLRERDEAIELGGVPSPLWTRSTTALKRPACSCGSVCRWPSSIPRTPGHTQRKASPAAVLSAIPGRSRWRTRSWVGAP